MVSTAHPQPTPAVANAAITYTPDWAQPTSVDVSSPVAKQRREVGLSVTLEIRNIPLRLPEPLVHEQRQENDDGDRHTQEKQQQ